MALSHPAVRTHIRQQLTHVVETIYGTPDIIAGVATGGIAWGAFVAHELGIPFCYVRASAKEHGKGNKVEGDLGAARKVVVIEDLISTGMSSLDAVEALRLKGLEVKGMVAIFSYGLDVAAASFESAGVELETLSNYEALLEVAEASSYLTADQASALTGWSLDPKAWSDKV